MPRLLAFVSRHHRLLTAALCVAVFMECAFIARVVMHSYPATADEYSFYYQAQIFATGQRALPMSGHLGGLSEMFMILYEGKLFSKYQPGFPALLSLAMLAGLPELLNPLLAALTAALIVHVLAQRFGWPRALGAGSLLLFMPYFLTYFASFYSQPLCAFLGACNLWLFMRHHQTGALKPVLLAGVVSGLCVLVRPLDGLCLLLAFALMCLSRNPRLLLPRLAALAAPFGLCTLALFLYNYTLTGCFCLANYTVWNNLEFMVAHPKAENFGQNLLFVAYEYLKNLRMNGRALLIEYYITYIGYGVFALSLLGMALARGGLARYALLHMALIVFLYNFHLRNGYPIYGARYWLACFAPYFLFVAEGLFALPALLSAKTALAATGLIYALQAFQTTEDLRVYHRRTLMRKNLQAHIEATCPPHSLIYLRIDPPQYNNPSDWPGFIVPYDAMRNPFLNGERLYTTNARWQKHMLPHLPGYTACTYHFLHEGIPVPPPVNPRLNRWLKGE